MHCTFLDLSQQWVHSLVIHISLATHDSMHNGHIFDFLSIDFVNVACCKLIRPYFFMGMAAVWMTESMNSKYCSEL